MSGQQPDGAPDAPDRRMPGADGAGDGGAGRAGYGDHAARAVQEGTIPTARQDAAPTPGPCDTPAAGPSTTPATRPYATSSSPPHEDSSPRPYGTPAAWQAARRPPLRFLISPWPLRCWAHALTGTLLGPAVLLTLALLIALGLTLTVVGIGLALLAAAALSGLPLGALERRRLRLVEPAAPLPGPHAPPPAPGVRAWLRTRLKERATWRELAYAALLPLAFTGPSAGVLTLLLFSALLVSTPVVVWALAPETVMVIPGQAIPHPAAALPFAAAGLLGTALSAYLAALLCGAQVKTARHLLGPRAAPSDERVIELTRSRARLADAFEAERRRIERDLHDGAQQQLVALTMTLGLAQLELGTDHPPASELLSRARSEARRALDQLRDLVRGIHPRVLTDHGLAAAVAEVTEHHPIPTTTRIDLPHRLPEQIETMAYFTITEALANAAKHSGASHLTVTAHLTRTNSLSLTITDDGRGGADPSAGTGLSGLADRLAIHRGRLVLSSPAGGPTRIHVEVPCSA